MNMDIKSKLDFLWRRGKRGGRTEASSLGKLIEANLSKWRKAQKNAPGPRVLMATSMGGFNHGATLESALAAALTLRGAQVEVLLCDSYLPACQLTKIGSLPPEKLLESRPMPRCESCQASGKQLFEPLGLRIHWYSQLVTPEQAQQARRTAETLPLEQITDAYRPDGLSVGEHAQAGALRYFARGNFAEEPGSEAVRRKYLEAAQLSLFAVQRLLGERDYDVVCFHHGLYVPQGLVVEACRNSNARVVTWNPAYRKHCFVFSHQDTYHHTMVSEPTADWEDMQWSPAHEQRTMDYLKSRWQGTQDWIWFHERPEEDADVIARQLGVDFTRPCVGLLSNVMWDAVLHYKSNAFPSMRDWVMRTISYFQSRPNLQLLIRAHPAEVRGFVPSRQKLVDEIHRAFPALPPNVFVIPPESPVSTYALVEKCDSVIIYNTKTGIELAAMGIPVIVAGEAWIRNKGFSLDASSPEEYFKLLDRLPLNQRMGRQETMRARKYAHHIFLRRMIPLPFVVSRPGPVFDLQLARLSDLDCGAWPGLDTICNGILCGDKFIHDEPAAGQVSAA